MSRHKFSTLAHWAVITSCSMLIQACMIPIPYDRHTWANISVRTRHFYSNDFIILTMDRIDEATYKEILVPVDGTSEYTSVESEHLCKILIPVKQLESLQELKCYTDLKGVEKYLSKHFGAHLERRRYDPDNILWQDKGQYNEMHNDLKILHPITGELALNMSRGEELAFYRSFGNNNILIDVLEDKQHLNDGHTPYEFTYDFDGKFILQVPPQHTVTHYLYPETLLSETEKENLAKQPGEARVLDVNYYEYATGRHGTWQIPVKYKAPKIWPTWATWTKNVYKFFSAYKHENLLTLVQRSDSLSDPTDVMAATLHNLDTSETFEAFIPLPYGKQKMRAIYDFDHARFYNIYTDRYKNPPKKDKFDGPYFIVISSIDIRTKQQRTYKLPIKMVDDIPNISD